MYEYASGLIRVLGKKILDQNDFERMLGAKTAADAFKVLNDTDYADNLFGLKPEGFEKALKRDEKDLKKLFFKIIDNELLLDFLFLKQDYLKLKLYLKAKFNPELKKSRVRPNLKIPRIKNPTSEKIDKICDIELYKKRKKIAKKLRDKFLQKICKKDLDLNYDLDFIKTEARNYAYGTPIILEYYFKKLNASRKMRTIMNAKLNNISQEELSKNI